MWKNLWWLLFFFSISTSNNDQKLIYKRILRGGEIPSNGLQKFPTNNNRGRHMKFSFIKIIIKKNIRSIYKTRLSDTLIINFIIVNHINKLGYVNMFM